MQSKSILYEYAVKMNLKSPQYRTTQQGQLHPVYVSTLLFNGESYPGKVGKSKKEAEQLVAFVAIESLLGKDLILINLNKKLLQDRQCR